MTAPKKGRAPRPKKDTADERQAIAERQRQWSEVTVGDTGVSYRYNLDMVPVGIRRRIAEETKGQTPESIVYSVARVTLLTYADVWWITRLVAGEDVTRDEAHAEWDERFGHVVFADITDVACDPPEASAQPA